MITYLIIFYNLQGARLESSWDLELKEIRTTLMKISFSDIVEFHYTIFIPAFVSLSGMNLFHMSIILTVNSLKHLLITLRYVQKVNSRKPLKSELNRNF